MAQFRKPLLLAVGLAFAVAFGVGTIGLQVNEVSQLKRANH